MKDGRAQRSECDGLHRRAVLAGRAAGAGGAGASPALAAPSPKRDDTSGSFALSLRYSNGPRCAPALILFSQDYKLVHGPAGARIQLRGQMVEPAKCPAHAPSRLSAPVTGIHTSWPGRARRPFGDDVSVRKRPSVAMSWDTQHPPLLPNPSCQRRSEGMRSSLHDRLRLLQQVGRRVSRKTRRSQGTTNALPRGDALPCPSRPAHHSTGLPSGGARNLPALLHVPGGSHIVDCVISEQWPKAGIAEGPKETLDYRLVFD